MLKLALLGGEPIRHSLSPALHTFFATKLGVSLSYTIKVAQSNDQAKQVMSMLESGALDGLNITAPFKELAASFGRPDNLTSIIQSANTLYRSPQGTKDSTIQSTSTDGMGLWRALEHTPKSALIVGAGGAARATAHALHIQGVPLFHYNRTPGRSMPHQESIHTLNALEDLNESIDLGVLAASAGYDAHKLSKIPVRAWVSLSYNAPTHNLINSLAEHGIAMHDGLGMLVHQGALGFEFWTGIAVSDDLVQEALAHLRFKQASNIG